MIRFLLTLFVLLVSIVKPSFSQIQQPSIFVKYSTDKIILDGDLDEAIWQTAKKAHDFWQYFPLDSIKSPNKTEVKMFYNDKYLYIGIRAESSKGGKFIVNSLRRDFAGPTNDNVSVVFDTFNDGTNAFMFSVNPYGVQREVLISGGGASTEGFNATWDIKWQSEGKIHDNFYTLELAIPFSSLKFQEGSQKWRFQTYRWDLQSNEQSAWAKVPQNQALSSVAFAGEMIFEKPLGKSKQSLYLIPYLNTLTGKSYNSSKIDNNFTFGGDAKVAIGNGMNLDVTLNPDFSNVEVDNVVTNLTRFEISLPEKRQFFIDNNDLFANFGNSFNEARPFFSRRIGIVTDTLGNSIENRILGGVRLSGKLDQNWRLGLLSIQTDEDLINKIASNNNSMFAIQRKLFSRSNIGAFFLNRETIGNYDFQNSNSKYNRVVGFDYNLASMDNKWSGKFYLHKSISPNDSEGNISGQATVTFNNRYFNIVHDWVYIDSEFRSDLGFIPRRDILKSGNGFARTFYPKGSMLNRITSRIVNIMYFKPTLEYKKTDHNLWFMNSLEFKNQATLGINYFNQYVYLFLPFDPTRTIGSARLPANSEYRYNQLNLTYTSNNSTTITTNATATLGEFFNGKIYSIGGTANLRIMPKALISLNVNFDRIELPSPYNTANILLLSPKFDLTFTKNLFWSTLVQFSNQRNSLGINSRLQWRYAPLSDLYLVYNDNYYTKEFGPTYRSINLKLSYWLNL
jgi:hypothetical protein